MKEASCSNCFYFEFIGLNETKRLGKNGFCHFNPPTPYQGKFDIEWRFCITFENNFCSNHPIIQGMIKNVMVQIGLQNEKERSK